MAGIGTSGHWAPKVDRQQPAYTGPRLAGFCAESQVEQSRTSVNGASRVASSSGCISPAGRACDK